MVNWTRSPQRLVGPTTHDRASGLAAAVRVASLLLVWVVACRQETPTRAARATPDATVSPTAAATPAASVGALPPQAPLKGILSVTTDLPCIVTVDGVEIGRLRRNSGDTFLVLPGRHLLAAVETDSQRSWASLVDVAVRERTEASIRFVPQMEEETTGFRPEMPAIDFVSIAAGEFWMGSGKVPPSLPHEGPRHRVRISRPFEIGRFQITQEQWKRVIRRNPTPWDLENNYQPVVNVSWEDTQEFLQRLNRLDSLHVYRLPTEAEWEYVCRAGSDRNAEPPDEGVRLGPGASPAAAGPKRANAWGLFDMRGPVSEWCQDWYDQSYYVRSPGVDPTGPPTGTNKVFRGGAFAVNAEGLVPGARASYPPTVKTTNIGFRVVREAR
jgi:formylglycine-generating enzyme required for sulfatase activity